jgi:hypothetical protein
MRKVILDMASWVCTQVLFMQDQAAFWSSASRSSLVFFLYLEVSGKCPARQPRWQV